MAAKLVDGPDGGALTTPEAALWLGWSESMFRRVARAERSWFKPTGVRGRKGELRWPWMSLVCLEYVYRRKKPPAKKPPAEESTRKKSGKSGGDSQG